MTLRCREFSFKHSMADSWTQRVRESSSRLLITNISANSKLNSEWLKNAPPVHVLPITAAWLLWCGVAQLVARRLAVRQARVRISARHHREVFPTEHRSDEEMERGLSKLRRINVLYECDCMNVYYNNMKNKQKEWHHATKQAVGGPP